MRRVGSFKWIVLAVVAWLAGGAGGAEGVFVVRVVDGETGRGVPMVRLTTVNEVEYWTDSAGVVAFAEPGLLGERVFFHVWSPGYSYPKDGFGYAGVALETRAGGEARVEVRRENVAQRLYRVTGQGIYGESVRAGLAAPLTRGVVNGGVLGQDSVQAAVLGERVWWFWGDTNRAGYPLGLFATAGAWSRRPGAGGLGAEVGVDLHYLVNEEGFCRAMTPFAAEGPVWVDAVCTVADELGRERLVGHWTNVRALGEPLGHGLAVFDEEAGRFVRWVDLELGELERSVQGQAEKVEDGGREWIVFGNPYPAVRVEARLGALRDPNGWEAWTVLGAGVRYTGPETPVERDEAGKVVYGWKRGGWPVTPEQERELVEAGVLKREEARQLPVDGAGEMIVLHRGSTRWNGYRRAWVTVGNRLKGESYLGEVYVTEARRLTEARQRAVKVATHAPWSFYNPVQHGFFDEDGGRVIYFEGTLSEFFSGARVRVPRYDYNQLMYRLDLAEVDWR